MDSPVALDGEQRRLHKPRRAWTTVVIKDGLVGVAWGVFFSVTIFEFLFLGAVLWVPLLLWLEFRRSRKPVWLAGLLVRGGLCVAIIMAADRVSMKYEDINRVGPLSATTLSLEDLASELRPYRVHIDSRDAPLPSAVIKMPSKSPTIRELIQAVEGASPFRYVPRKCGNGKSILWGSYPMGEIELEMPR